MCDIDSDSYHVTSVISAAANQRSDLMVSTSPPIMNVGKSDVWLTVHRNSVWIRKTN